MDNLLNRFREIYNLPENASFRRAELENALIEKFGDLHYNKYVDIFADDTPRYTVSCKNKWGIYEITSGCHGSIEDSLLYLFIKYGKEPEEGTEAYFVENFKEEFQEIVKEIYK